MSQQTQNFKKSTPDSNTLPPKCKTISKPQKKQSASERNPLADLGITLPKPSLPKALRLPERNNWREIGAMHAMLAENRTAELTGVLRGYLEKHNKDINGHVMIQIALMAHDVFQLLPEDYRPIEVLRRKNNSMPIAPPSDKPSYQEQKILTHSLSSDATIFQSVEQLGRFSQASLRELIGKDKGAKAQEGQYQVREILRTTPTRGIWAFGGTGTGKSHALAVQAKWLLQMKELGHEDVANLQLFYYRSDTEYLEMLKADWKDSYDGPIALTPDIIKREAGSGRGIPIYHHVFFSDFRVPLKDDAWNREMPRIFELLDALSVHEGKLSVACNFTQKDIDKLEPEVVRRLRDLCVPIDFGEWR